MSLKRLIISVYCIGLFVCAAGSTLPAAASPFISEIILPDTGATGVEINGLGPEGGTLLIVNASRSRLSVQQVFSLPAASETVWGLGTAVVAGPGWEDVDGTNTSVTATVFSDKALFSANLPVILVLVEGRSTIVPSVSLGNDPDLSYLFQSTPIVDWVSFAIDPEVQPTLPPVEISDQTLASLDIQSLPRPSISTAGATVLARAVTIDGPILDTLLRGNTQYIDGSALGLSNFLFTPGMSNPLTALAPDDEPHMPEPASGVLLALGVVAGARRPKRRA